MVCHGCGSSFRHGDVQCDSSLYAPGEKFTLCEKCSSFEEGVIAEHGNDQPKIVQLYRRIKEEYG